MTEGNPSQQPVEEVVVPAEGVWRIGPATDPYHVGRPLKPEELNDPFAGHRFDSPLGNYGVLYFATRLEGCFGETLARFRPDVELVAVIRPDWRSLNFMAPGNIPADWRHRRLAVRATPADGSEAVFLDVESSATRAVLREELAPALVALGVDDLDVPTIRGGDRRVTRIVSFWAWSQRQDDGRPRYSGIRYVSRLSSDWECWAIFDRVSTRELERRQVTHEMAELKAVVDLWGLTVH